MVRSDESWASSLACPRTSIGYVYERDIASRADSGCVARHIPDVSLHSDQICEAPFGELACKVFISGMNVTRSAGQ